MSFVILFIYMPPKEVYLKFYKKAVVKIIFFIICMDYFFVVFVLIMLNISHFSQLHEPTAVIRKQFILFIYNLYVINFI